MAKRAIHLPVKARLVKAQQEFGPQTLRSRCCDSGGTPTLRVHFIRLDRMHLQVPLSRLDSLTQWH